MIFWSIFKELTLINCLWLKVCSDRVSVCVRVCHCVWVWPRTLRAPRSALRLSTSWWFRAPLHWECDGALLCSALAPVAAIIPPPPDIQPVIDKLAEYVARNGLKFETSVRAKNDQR